MLKHGLNSAAVGCPVGNVEACGMSGFDSLTWALDGWFEASLCDLPEVLRQRVKREFLPMPWDQLTALKRQSVVSQVDYWNDPDQEVNRQFWWDFYERLATIKAQISSC